MTTRKPSAEPSATVSNIRQAGRPAPLDPDRMIAWSYEQLASKTGLSIGTLRRRVNAGTGPRVVLIGKHHRFLPKDVDRWLDALRSATEAA